MQLKKYAVILALGGIVLIGLGKCGKEPEMISGTKQTPLQDDEQLRVNIKRDQIKIVRKDRPDLVTTNRRVDISIKNDGRVVVKERKWGFVFEPGLGFIICDRAGLSLNTQILYYRSFGLDIGCGYVFNEKPRHSLKPYWSLGYDLPFKHTRNTTVFAGMTFQKEPLVGIKVKF